MLQMTYIAEMSKDRQREAFKAAAAARQVSLAREQAAPQSSRAGLISQLLVGLFPALRRGRTHSSVDCCSSTSQESPVAACGTLC